MAGGATTPIILAPAAFVAAVLATSAPAFACTMTDFAGQWRLVSDRPNDSSPSYRCSVFIGDDGVITGSDCVHRRLGRFPIEGRFTLDEAGGVTGQVTDGSVDVAVVASVTCANGRARVIGTAAPEKGLFRPAVPFRGRRVAATP